MHIVRKWHFFWTNVQFDFEDQMSIKRIYTDRLLLFVLGTREKCYQDLGCFWPWLRCRLKYSCMHWCSPTTTIGQSVSRLSVWLVVSQILVGFSAGRVACRESPFWKITKWEHISRHFQLCAVGLLMVPDFYDTYTFRRDWVKALVLQTRICKSVSPCCYGRQKNCKWPDSSLEQRVELPFVSMS